MTKHTKLLKKIKQLPLRCPVIVDSSDEMCCDTECICTTSDLKRLIIDYESLVKAAEDLVLFEEMLEVFGFIEHKPTGKTFREVFTALQAELEST